MSGRLWVCHGCKMIGTAAEAKAHYIARGHETEELSDEVSDSIRDEWNDIQARRVAGLRMAARIIETQRDKPPADAT